MNTRKYPRTLEEAFGPYERGPVHEQKPRTDWQDKVVVTACIIAAMALVFIFTL